MSTRSQAIIVEILHELGLPAEVLHLLLIFREAASKSTAQIIVHPFVRKINFSGRNRVGRIITMEAANSSLEY
ncbi:uncharacterized protein C8R40DRAFT_82811 [Lentinula edodes]|uniref:uncharacterized protein n=1 Tax=Lentinula edodes TaxID=5353 RepID=UPI001E8EC4D7|nr:uncharacterized protein C8R40DRAFT_82811 [Lentinula edodes]KAH7876938.1 hypothetical protein C8R40DRAFT_82811 [Lentinula edodes]